MKEFGKGGEYTERGFWKGRGWRELEMGGEEEGEDSGALRVGHSVEGGGFYLETESIKAGEWVGRHSLPPSLPPSLKRG